MSAFLKSLTDDMEKIARMVEEGAKIITGSSSDFGDQTNHDGVTSRLNFDGIGLHDAEDDSTNDEDHYGSPLMGMANSVITDIMSSQNNTPQTAFETIQAFSAAITWNEAFIKYLIAFHVLILIIATVIIRKGDVSQHIVFMVVIGLIVRMAERLNQFGNSRWRDFATQNYFDKSGIFMGTMVCAPMIIICFTMLVSLIKEASNLLTEITRMKKEKKRKLQNLKKKD